MDVAASSDGDTSRWCIAQISRIASTAIDPPPPSASIESLMTLTSTAALISQFAAGNRPNTLFLSLSIDGALSIDESLPLQQQPSSTCVVLTRTSSAAINPSIPWSHQTILLTLPPTSTIDTLHVLFTRTSRSLLDAAAAAPLPSKHVPKAQAQLADLCTTLRMCIGSKRAEPVDFDRALASHGELRELLATQAQP